MTASAASDKSVIVYGQVLHPELVKLRFSDYTWKDLEYLMPKLLSDKDKYKYTPEETCDRLNKLNDLYLIEVEERTNDLIYKMEYVVNEGLAEPPADLALTMRLASKSPEALKQLMQFLPEEQKQLEEAKAFTLASLVMILLRDAALLNCPEYAKEKEYYPISTYSDPE